MLPLTKACPKMVLSHKGGSICVKDVFAKKFFGAGRDTRALRFCGTTLVKSGHLMRPSVVSGTVRGLALQGGQGLAAPIQNDSGLPQKCHTQACTTTCTVDRSHLAALATKGFSGKCRKAGASPTPPGGLV